MVLVEDESAEKLDAAMAIAEAGLAGNLRAVEAGSAEEVAPKSLSDALFGLAANDVPGIAQVSVPGPYAAAEALKALARGMDVFLFSDNVPLEQERAIKLAASQRGRLVMGPDCGTAIIGGVPLGFANAVRRGNIGLVAASGTGLQEVSTQIHRMGGGVSHAIGTGGRDVYAEVGGATMLQGISLLAADPGTKVIAVVSKPPAPAVAQRVLDALRASGKPSVVIFIGSETTAPRRGNAASPRIAHTLVDCAAMAVRLAGVKRQAPAHYPLPRKPVFAKSQKYLRALYAGGTFTAEAQSLWAGAGLKVWSNVPLEPALELSHPRQSSREHTALDLGDDAFTVGRPHPMIDQAARIERLLIEAADPSVRVILLDVVIGWGAHSNPAAELATAITQAKVLAAKRGRQLAIVGFVCGTEADPQVLSQQEALLRKAGMVLGGNSANAAWLAGQWLR